MLKKHKNWRASIHKDGLLTHLGCFSNKEDAIEARLAAQRELGFSDTHGKPLGACDA